MGAAESFGRYELIKLVGAGGMAFVHLARQLGPDGFVKPCVLKRIMPEIQGHEAMRQMFLEEARITALLNHPNIVQTFDYGSVDATPYMALELIDGVNLAHFCRTLALKKRWLPVQPAVDICLKLLDALQYAHELIDLDGRPLRLVHRDVSPQNTLLSRQGGVKLADFGIARHEARATYTQAGEPPKGKPGYMAPEQAMGDTTDRRADLFSVGILLTELISARRVMANHERPNERTTGVLGIADRIRHLFAYRPEAPRDLESVAQRLCALDPNQRPATAAQAATELRGAMSGHIAGQPLEQFLQQVFAKYLPDDTLGAALISATSRSPSPQPPIRPPPPSSSATPPPVHPSTGVSAASAGAPPASYGAGFRNDPTDGHLPFSPSEPAEAAEGDVRTAWAAAAPHPREEGTGHVYEHGWPKQFLPEEQPQLQLVSRSATMEAMQYFGAEESEEVKQGRAADLFSATAARPRSVLGAPALPPSQPRPANPGHRTALHTPTSAGDPVHDPYLERVLDHLRGNPAAAQESPPPARRRRETPAVLPLALAGILMVVVGLIVVSLFSGGNRNPGPTALPKTGKLTVTSQPPDARIFLNRRDTGKTTPQTLSNLAIGRPLHVSVQLPEHLSVPRDITLTIPVQSGQTSANFTLRPGRVFSIVTEPVGAVVTVNGKRLSNVTPLTLEPIPFGDTATVTLEQEGYLPHRLLLDPKGETPAERKIELEPATTVVILSEPPGGEVLIDRQPRGRTPLYDLRVPSGRRFRVTVKKPGFRTWSRRVRSRSGDEIIANLEYLPFMQMPMNRQERATARGLQSEVNRLESDVKKLQGQLGRARRRLENLESRSSPLIGPVAEAQRYVDLVRSELHRREEALIDARSKLDVFREQILLKAELEN